MTNPELDPLLGGFGVRTVVQAEQLGTGHAVRIALDAIEPAPAARGPYGDMPLVDRTIFEDVQRPSTPTRGTALALVTARMPLPSNFGRIVRDGRAPCERIVEAKDCTPEQLALDEMNAGIYAYDEAALRETIVQIGNDNAQREYYLTDTVELLLRSGRRVAPVPVADYRSVLGVNDRVELAQRRRDPQPPAVRAAHARRRDDRRSGDDVSRTGARPRARRDDPAEHDDLRRDAGRRGLEHRPRHEPVRRNGRRALSRSPERRDRE